MSRSQEQPPNNSYKIWTSDEIANLSKLKQKSLQWFFDFINIHKNWEYVLLGLQKVEFTFESFHRYVHVLTKRKATKGFDWEPFELNQPWNIHNFTVLTEDGLKLACTYIYSNVHHPQNNQKTIILVHGLNSHRYKALFQGLVFLRKGYNVLVYDQRNHGQSEGIFSSFGWFETKDLELVIAKAQSMFAWTELNFAGWSMGAMVVLEYLKKHYQPSLTKFAILDAVIDRAINIWRVIIEEKMKISWFNNFYLFKQTCITRFHYDPEWINPIDNIDKIKSLPILFIFNSHDAVVKNDFTLAVCNAKARSEEPKLISKLLVFHYGHCAAIYKDFASYNMKIYNFIKNTYDTRK